MADVCTHGMIVRAFSNCSGKPLIYNISSDKTVSVVSGHESVVLLCIVVGENITGGYWKKVNGSLVSSHNKSKLSHNHRKTVTKIHLIITKARPTHSGEYQCTVYSQWAVVRSRNVQVIVKCKDWLLCS